MNNHFQIGDFRFDPTSGELTRANLEHDAPSVRLPPQPAQLLQLLVSRQPEIVTRQQIQEVLWPGVPSDFDRNLHFCIRQIRSALGDSAASPKYVETIPRRGYRLIVDVETLRTQPVDQHPENADTNGSVKKTVTAPDDPLGRAQPQMDGQALEVAKNGRPKSLLTRGRLALVLVVASVGMITVVFSIANMNPFAGFLSTDKVDVQNVKTRIAIMPFVPKQAGFEDFRNGKIALDLLDRLSRELNQSMEVIGPTTTARYDQAPEQLLNLVEDAQPEYVVNGRFILDQQRHRLLAEIIRASDGVHVWVKYFESNEDCDFIVGQISDELIRISQDKTSQ